MILIEREKKMTADFRTLHDHQKGHVQICGVRVASQDQERGLTVGGPAQPATLRNNDHVRATGGYTF